MSSPIVAQVVKRRLRMEGTIAIHSPRHTKPLRSLATTSTGAPPLGPQHNLLPTPSQSLPQLPRDVDIGARFGDSTVTYRPIPPSAKSKFAVPQSLRDEVVEVLVDPTSEAVVWTKNTLLVKLQ
jgi:hypothetical protein